MLRLRVKKTHFWLEADKVSTLSEQIKQGAVDYAN